MRNDVVPCVLHGFLIKHFIMASVVARSLDEGITELDTVTLEEESSTANGQ